MEDLVRHGLLFMRRLPSTSEASQSIPLQGCLFHPYFLGKGAIYKRDTALGSTKLPTAMCLSATPH